MKPCLRDGERKREVLLVVGSGNNTPKENDSLPKL